MPFQPINYAGIEPQGNPFLRDFAQTLAQGMKTGAMPGEIQRRSQQEQLANALQQMQVQQEPQRFEAWQKSQPFIDALKNSEANKNMRDANNPFYGLPSGEGGQGLLVPLAEQMWGKDDPRTISLKQRVNLDIENKRSQMNARDTYASTVNKKYATPLAKEEQEIAEIQSGYMPGTNREQQLAPDEQQEMLGRAELKRQKGISDTQTRQRALFASNVDKTIEGINPKDLTQYSGAPGMIKLKSDQLQSSLGKPSESFMKYNKAITLSSLLGKQVRQFYGDSITPQIQEKLSMLTNPTSWQNDPQVALENFNTFKDILKKETGTYRGALKNTKEYQGDNSSSPKKATMRFNPATGMLEAIK